MKPNTIFLSVVIPQYNEIANLHRGVVEEVINYLSKQKYTWEVVISDDGSDDGSYTYSKETIRSLDNVNIIQSDHGGKAAALLHGIREAKGEYVLITDMDQSTPISEVKKLLYWTGKKYDIVIGSRGLSRTDAPIIRQWAGFLFGIVRRSLLLPEIKDTQCGFKLLKRQIALDLFPKLDAVQPTDVDGWKVTAFDVELLFMTKKIGFRTKEVHVKWSNRDVSTTKNKSIAKESLSMLQQIFIIRKNSILRKY